MYLGSAWKHLSIASFKEARHLLQICLQNNFIHIAARFTYLSIIILAMRNIHYSINFNIIRIKKFVINLLKKKKTESKFNFFLIISASKKLGVTVIQSIYLANFNTLIVMQQSRRLFPARESDFSDFVNWAS